MIEVYRSSNLAELCKVHNDFIAIDDSEEVILFKPTTLIFKKSVNMWELTVELHSNKVYDEDYYGGNDFCTILIRK
jgi:hypothetical protein